MSNLIKSGYINVTRNNSFVIDSNKKLSHILPSEEQKNELEDDTLENFEFIPGINVLNIEKLIEEETSRMEEQTSQIIKNAKEKADEIIRQAKAKAVFIKEDAYEEGKKQGYEEGKADSEKLFHEKITEMENNELRRQEEYENVLEQLEPKFANILVSLVTKVTGLVIEDKKEIVLYLIKNCIRGLEKSNRYIVRVSKEDTYYLDTKKEEIKKILPEGASIEFLEEPSFEKNQCIIETDSQMIDCSLDTQLDKLVNDIKLLV